LIRVICGLCCPVKHTGCNLPARRPSRQRLAHHRRGQPPHGKKHGCAEYADLLRSFGASVFFCQRVAVRNASELTYLHDDHLGSSSLTTNASGSIVSQLRYYPFGGTRPAPCKGVRRAARRPRISNSQGNATRAASGCMITMRAITTHSSADSSVPIQSCPKRKIHKT
jgi:hypothetical protein